MSDAGGTARVTLRAALGRPLEDTAVRDIVIANAHAIAERQGVEVISVEAEASSVAIEIRGSNIEAMGLAAELRRTTNRWHQGVHGVALWGDA